MLSGRLLAGHANDGSRPLMKLSDFVGPTTRAAWVGSGGAQGWEQGAAAQLPLWGGHTFLPILD
jgi:hypothetical protein